MAQAKPREHSSSSRSKKVAPPLQFEGVSSRPAWKGNLRLSLVMCPVGLYRATNAAAEVSFNLINPETGNRIKMVTTDAETGEQVERSSLVKGYAVEKDNYVTFTDEELRSVRLETTSTLEIERFVNADSIDRLYWDLPYLLVPQDESAVEAYGVIQQAMVKANMVALGRVVMHTRERLLAIEPRDGGLLATTLRTKDEVVDTARVLKSVSHGKVDKQMIDIAERIIDQLKGPFDTEEFTDRYEDALRAVIDQKLKGHKITTARAPTKSANVVDLMDALKKSLGATPATPKASAKKAVEKPKRRRA